MLAAAVVEGRGRACSQRRRRGPASRESYLAKDEHWPRHERMPMAGLRSAGVAPAGFAARSVGGHLRSDEQESRLLMRDGAVLGAARDDEQVAGSEIDVAISHLDGDVALD